ncbi:MAG: PilZ domain-containing protein [Desulfobacter sp.]|nr:MAG: PilZ domain-containing protein [Desulfobacter sp.]
MAIENAYLPPEERRNAPRTPCHCIVDVVVDGRLYKEQAVDISDTGIFLKSKCRENYHVFDEIALSFQLPGQNPVKHSGIVARITEEGIGVLFTGIDYPDVNRLAPQIEALFEAL